MSSYTKQHGLELYSKNAPGSYPITPQQARMMRISAECGIVHGISKFDLMLKMKNCMGPQMRGGGERLPKTTVFVSTNCTPCQEVKDLLRDKPDVEVVDIETDDGFNRFVTEVLSKGDGEVPSAYQDGHPCAIMVDDATHTKVTFECGAQPPEPTSDQPSGPPE